MLGLPLALCAGLSAALASSFAKFAMSPEILRHLVCESALFHSMMKSTSGDDYCQWVVISCRVLSFSMVFVFNALMWTLFVKSLRKCSSTAVATVTNTGSNLIFTAILGMVLFGETQSIRWWMGASVILIGLLVIHHSHTSKHDKDKTL